MNMIKFIFYKDRYLSFLFAGEEFLFLMKEREKQRSITIYNFDQLFQWTKL